MARKASPIGLRTWVWILAGLFVVCTLPLMAIALVQGTLRFTAAEDNLASLRQLRQTFDLANLVSAERGPANSLLGADPADAAEQAPLAAQLAAARKRVDAALLQLDTVFKADPGVVDEHGLLADAQRRLQSARAAVDRVLAQPHDARRVEEVERAISGMFAVVDRLHLLTSAQINVLVSADREAAIPAMQGQVLIDLREHGGRLASNVMAPVAVPGAWREEQVRAALQTEGRLLELWRLAGSHESVFRSDPELSWHWDMARRQFFGESLPMIEQLIEDGRRGLPPPWTAAEFTTRYVPTLQSLEALRDGYLSVSIARFERTRNREAMRLAVLVATALGTLVVLGVALRIAHRQILQPLLQAQAQAQVIQLASDAPGPEQHVTHPLAEMQRLFDAIEVLREKSRERSALTSELRQLAGTDELTGLLNRRALDEVVQQRHAGGDASAVVILLDVDRFKAINDGHGHDAGDEVLVRVAQLLRHQLRRSDSIARYGGEEFLVLLADGDLAGGRQLAESLRLALQQMDIALAGGTVLRVTASFGVAEGGTDALGWRTLLRAADAAMYRAKAQGRDRVRVAGGGRITR
ncbi:GGDEF domain-containing protein [Stenotrophomonas maltophilia]|uniref:GGDEF domain-containing protein n=1 Tax=Stenotrophomonas maltophilia TaxID=40324 RepID=UPI0013DC5018|nr:GGDEF domain-containing protein [Stenotrophomonas maltophilia]